MTKRGLRGTNMIVSVLYAARITLFDSPVMYYTTRKFININKIINNKNVILGYLRWQIGSSTVSDGKNIFNEKWRLLFRFHTLCLWGDYRSKCILERKTCTWKKKYSLYGVFSIDVKQHCLKGCEVSLRQTSFEETQEKST